jgi:methionyl-tRNA formyltransferase
VRILLLGPPRPALEAYLSSFGDDVVRTEDPLTPLALARIDRIVSYGYRHIVRRDVVSRFGDRAVNLHVSLLPWNRGADPNLWSFLDDTPAGVTVHVIDDGVDTGPVVGQREVSMELDDTLGTSYARLSVAMDTLFREVWPAVRAGDAVATTQPSGGSSHRAADKHPYEYLLTAGWDTPVASLVRKADGKGGTHG